MGLEGIVSKHRDHPYSLGRRAKPGSRSRTQRRRACYDLIETMDDRRRCLLEGGIMKIRDVASLCAIALALGACGQAPQGPQGDPGPPGPVGPTGPPGPAAGVRLVRSACDTTSCTVQCEADEVLVTAWCGVTRNPTNFPTDRSAICRGRGAANSPLVGVCAKSAGP
jgi:hypothetical protein